MDVTIKRIKVINKWMNLNESEYPEGMTLEFWKIYIYKKINNEVHGMSSRYITYHVVHFASKLVSYTSFDAFLLNAVMLTIEFWEYFDASCMSHNAFCNKNL